MMKNETNKLFEQLTERFKGLPGVEVPPRIYIEMEAELIDYQENQLVTIKFPNKSKYRNPMGHMQGGVIVAAIDNTYGPLSYLVAPPSATTQINTQYIRPVLAEDKFIEVSASLIERTQTQILMRAEVRNEKKKLVAVSQATHQIIRNS